MSAHQKPRLLVLTSTYPRWSGDHEPGFVHELAKRLTDRFEVMVLGPHAAGAVVDERLDGVRVIRYRYAPGFLETLVNDGGMVANLRHAFWKWLLVPGFFIGLWWAFLRARREWRPDVIHAHWLVPQGVVAAIARKDVPLIVTSHGADLFAISGRAYAWLRAYVVGRASRITVVSQAMRQRLRQEIPAADPLVMPMGVDFAVRFVPDHRQQRSRTVILFVGRLVEKKGLLHLIEAMPTILARHPRIQLDIIGYGPERKRLGERIAELGIEDRVHFLGAVAQALLPSHYQRAAVCVAPFVEAADGDQEGLGLVVAEAVGCLCPVVAGDVQAVYDLLDADCAHIVSPRDTDALAAAIVDVLDHPDAAQSRVAHARTQIERKISWTAVANGYADLFNAIVIDSKSR
ncbi:glycosyltransferase family 4 protein [Dyella tabacisoli]|uniref:Glycosyltransferase family 4 protein n=1 Tax=Dyella tabacisoli TaxID=2282381 RepID=A0A369UP06_9GAMM|nr:glycosyltransferase family 4 protein [Dyella tabacisoli]RDD82484.1 glycosyltransferase family 4 protein [Dyella tabacisoli]